MAATRTRRHLRVVLIMILLCGAAEASQLARGELERIRNGFDERRDAMLHRQVSNTYPPLPRGGEYGLFAWHHLDFALAALYLNTELARANTAVVEVCNLGPRKRISNGEQRFHWMAPLLCRIFEFFHAGSRYFPGRLAPKTETAVRQVLWSYLAEEGSVERFAVDNVWWYWGSENHDAQKTCSLWGAAKILSESPEYHNRRLKDGRLVTEHFRALNAYNKEQMRQRVKKGLLVECASPGYSKYTLQCWYNYYDFGDDELRRLTDIALDVWWTDWAQEQLSTVRGGAKCRVYQGDGAQKARSDAAAAMAWYYLGVGPPRNPHPGLMCMATSAHRLPLVVMDIALDPAGRGAYECRSRRPGLMRDRDPTRYPRTPSPEGINRLDPDDGGLVRYTYCTPDFIMGSWMMARRPLHDWAPISSQNRWQGVIFAGRDPDARIFPQCVGLRNGKTYNQYWSVQSKGAMIVCRLPPRAFSKQSGDMRVFFADSLRRSERDGWVFAEAERAYAAVYVVGGATWDDAHWLRASNSDLPVVIDVAGKRDFDSLVEFQRSVLALRLDVGDGTVTHKGILDAGELAFHFGEGSLPEVDGVAIDLHPPYTFASPFLDEAWNSGVVTIQKGARKLILDVSGHPVP